MKNFIKLKNPSSWRRISLATWQAPNDPTVYGKFPVEFSKGLEYIEKINQNSNLRVTVTHYVAKAMAMTLKKHADLNGIVRFGKIYLRQSVDIFLQVAVDRQGQDKKSDLSGAKIEHCDQKSLEEISQELKNKSGKIRQDEDEIFKESKSLLNKIPAFFLGPIVRLMSFLTYDLGFNLERFGIPYDGFGSAMVTSVGMLKVPAGFAPLVPLSRCPLILCVGEVTQSPWVEDGVVKAKPILDLSFTFDHRFMDGLSGSRMVHYFREILQNPEEYFEKEESL